MQAIFLMQLRFWAAGYMEQLNTFEEPRQWESILYGHFPIKLAMDIQVILITVCIDRIKHG